MTTVIRNAIRDEARTHKRLLRALLLKSNMTAHLDPEQAIRVLDVLLNVPHEDIEAMMNHSRQVAGNRRELASGRWS